LNIILSTAIVGFTIWLGRIFFGGTIGLIAGALMAISPSEITFVTIYASELPFTLLILSGVTAWFSLRLSNFSRAILAGLAFGAATYFRSIALLLPLVLWFTAVPNWQKLRAELPIALLSLFMTFVAIAPWSMRNTEVFGHFVPISTSEGANLWIGNNPDATGFFMGLPQTTPRSSEYEQNKVLSEYEQNKVLGERAKQYIFAEPGVFVLRLIKKVALLHTGETTSITWNAEAIKSRFGENAVFPLKLLTQGYWTVTLLFALGGIAAFAKARGIMHTLTEPMVLIWIYFTAIYSIYFVADRYHFPSRPFISVLAAFMILACTRFTSRGGERISKL
jgi:4-amino-4-deoxy-L-arabinose transferase-like glycosyltransferase